MYMQAVFGMVIDGAGVVCGGVEHDCGVLCPVHNHPHWTTPLTAALTKGLVASAAKRRLCHYHGHCIYTLLTVVMVIQLSRDTRHASYSPAADDVF